MGVAGIYVAPGVDDADDRLAPVLFIGVAHLLGPRTVAEGAQVAHPVPAVAAQFFGSPLSIHQRPPHPILTGSNLQPTLPSPMRQVGARSSIRHGRLKRNCDRASWPAEPARPR